MDKNVILDLAYAFRNAKPWKRIYEQEPFAITLPDGQIGYCCLMGRNGEHMALSLYIGAIGFSALRNLHEMKPDATTAERLTMDCIQCSVEKKEQLSEEELDDLRAYCKVRGIPFAAPFPQFSRYSPNCIPWAITRSSDWEAIITALTIVVKLCEVLESSPKEKLGLRDIIIGKTEDEYVPTLLSPLEDDGPLTIPLYSIQGNDLHINRIPLPPYTEATPQPPTQFNDIAVRRLKKLRRNGILECEIIRLPEPVDGTPPYLPALLMGVDHTMADGAEYDPNELLEEFIEGLIESKLYPERIMVRTNETATLLHEFCRRASIRLVNSERLDLLDEAVSSLEDKANDNTPGGDIDQMLTVLRQMSVEQIRLLPDFIMKDLRQMTDSLPKDIADKIRKALR